MSLLTQRQEEIFVAASASSSVKLNEKAWAKMSICERETGKSAQELVEQQQSLRADFYRRVSA